MPQKYFSLCLSGSLVMLLRWFVSILTIFEIFVPKRPIVFFLFRVYYYYFYSHLTNSSYYLNYRQRHAKRYKHIVIWAKHLKSWTFTKSLNPFSRLWHPLCTILKAATLRNWCRKKIWLYDTCSFLTPVFYY